jgi:hypothetical protein
MKRKTSRKPPRKGKHGGEREGAGLFYDPRGRISLAYRYEELYRQFVQEGVPKPGTNALYTLHAEEHPDGGGNPESTKRLIIRARQEDNFLTELGAKQHNGEPLTAFEQDILRRLSLSWRRHAKNIAKHRAARQKYLKLITTV